MIGTKPTGNYINVASRAELQSAFSARSSRDTSESLSYPSADASSRTSSRIPSDTRCRGRTMEATMLESAIVIDPDVMNGTPCFRGTRVPFKNLIDYIEGGHSLGEFLRQFPTVTHELAVQALEEAKESLLARIA